MAGPIRSAFVNIAKNAAASTAQKMVSGVAGSLRSGLGGSSASSASSPLQTNFNPEPSILLYPLMLVLTCTKQVISCLLVILCRVQR
jgi:hypothetical protein